MRMLEDQYRLWVLLVLLVCGLLLVWTGAKASLPTETGAYVTRWQLPAPVVSKVATVATIGKASYWRVQLGDGRWVYATNRPVQQGTAGGWAENRAVVWVRDGQWPCAPQVYGETMPLTAVLKANQLYPIGDVSLRCLG